MLRLKRIVIGVCFMLLTLGFASRASASPENNPIFTTIEYVNTAITNALPTVQEQIDSLLGRTNSLEDRVDDLESRVEYLENLHTQTPTPTPQTIFEDNFSAHSLDNDKWEYFDTDGGVYALDGSSITVPSGNNMFYIRSKDNPFPTSGPFTVEFGIQYTQVDVHGDGVALGFETQNGYDPNNVPIAYWQGNNFGLQVVRFGLTETVVGSNPDLGYHIVKIVYDGEKYSLFLDGILKYTSPNSATAKSLWFGNPSTGIDNWTGFKLDYIKVTTP